MIITLLILSNFINGYFVSIHNINFSQFVNLAAIPVSILLFPAFLKFAFNKVNYLILIIYLIFATLFILYFEYASLTPAYESMGKFFKVAPFLLTPLLATYVSKEPKIFIFIFLMVLLFFDYLILNDYEKVLLSMARASRGAYAISPLSLSAINTLASLTFAYYFFKTKNKIYLLFVFLFVIASGIGGSKGPILAFGISFFYLWWRYNKNLIKIMSLSILALAASLFAMYLLAEFSDMQIFNRLLDLNNSVSSTNERKDLYDWTFNYVLENNIFVGNGVNSFPYLNGVLDEDYPHNIFLGLSFEIGLLPTLLFFGSCIAVFIISHKRNHPFLSSLVIFYFLIVQFSFDLGFLRNLSLVFFLMLCSKYLILNESHNKH